MFFSYNKFPFGVIIMKRIFSLLVCILVAASILVFPVSAAELPADEQIIVSRTVQNMGDGFYCIETISVPAVQPYANTKTGTKTAQFVSSGTTVFALSVTGTFTYGSTSEATSASYSITTYVENATVKDCSAHTSGASAVATGSVSYQGFTLQKTVTLTCDKNGNLS